MNIELKPPKRKKLSAETRQWLGLTPADGLCAVAFGLVAVAWFVPLDPPFLLVCYVVGVIAAILAVPLGALPNPELSRFMNFMKKWSYHVGLVGVVLAFWARFLDLYIEAVLR